MDFTTYPGVGVERAISMNSLWVLYSIVSKSKFYLATRETTSSRNWVRSSSIRSVGDVASVITSLKFLLMLRRKKATKLLDAVNWNWRRSIVSWTTIRFSMSRGLFFYAKINFAVEKEQFMNNFNVYVFRKLYLYPWLLSKRPSQFVVSMQKDLEWALRLSSLKKICRTNSMNPSRTPAPINHPPLKDVQNIATSSLFGLAVCIHNQWNNTNGNYFMKGVV